MNSYLVIVTGTDPESRKGGIGFSLPGYLRAMGSADIVYRSIPTYSPDSYWGKWWWLVRALPVILKQIKLSRDHYQEVIVYSHAGAGISLVREGVLLVLARTFGVHTVIQLHAMEIVGYLGSSMKKKMLVPMLSNVGKLAVLTPWWKDYLSRFFDSERISVVPNPLPQEWESKAALPVIAADKPILNILSMTRIEDGKGVDLTVEAMQFLPDNFELIIAGAGTQLANMKKKVRDLNLYNRVRFTGWVSGAAKQVLLDDADVFCLPSSNDSFGMGFVEAMANGLPVVALDWGPISDVVPHERAGLLIAKPDANELALTLKSLLDVSLRKKLGKEGKRWVLENFSADHVGEVLRTTFEEMLS